MTHQSFKLFFDSSKAFEYCYSDDSAVLFFDMGDSHPEVAIPILIRLLESFDSNEAPIEAVVYGWSGEKGGEKGGERGYRSL